MLLQNFIHFASNCPCIKFVCVKSSVSNFHLYPSTLPIQIERFSRTCPVLFIKNFFHLICVAFLILDYIDQCQRSKVKVEPYHYSATLYQYMSTEPNRLEHDINTYLNSYLLPNIFFILAGYTIGKFAKQNF